jgi:hypothetical protein
MSRVLIAAVAASLAFPVLALGALIGQQEHRWTDATIVNVPLRGYDPRDLLAGHYIAARLDWDWTAEPTATDGRSAIDGAVCVLPGDAPKPRVRFLPDWTVDSPAEAGCRAIMAGEGWVADGGRPARFAPASLDDGDGGLKVFVPEARALDFEEMLRQRAGALSVDLAVRSDGNAAIRAVRVDGKVLGR